MKKSTMLKTIIASLILLPLTVLSQEDVSKEFITKHAKYLMKGGGIWEAENEKFDPDKQYDASTFQYMISPGVHSESIAIEIKSDITDIGWYTSWDGYYLWHPEKKEVIYHSLSSNGAIANGIIQTPDSITQINIFTILSYEGESAFYKDVTKQVNENEMHSESFSLDKNGNWEHNQKLIWKRVIKKKE